jgi:hypothetical protein
MFSGTGIFFSHKTNKFFSLSLHISGQDRKNSKKFGGYCHLSDQDIFSSKYGK